MSPSKLDPYAKMLSTWPQMEVTKLQKQRRNLRQILHPHLFGLSWRRLIPLAYAGMGGSTIRPEAI